MNIIISDENRDEKFENIEKSKYFNTINGSLNPIKNNKNKKIKRDEDDTVNLSI